MTYGVKSALLRGCFFCISVAFIVTGYTLAYNAYTDHYHVQSHRSVGLAFVGFYFYFIAFPVLLVTAFIPVRWGAALYLLTTLCCIAQWYAAHPLRVLLMTASTTGGYLLLLCLRRRYQV